MARLNLDDETKGDLVRAVMDEVAADKLAIIVASIVTKHGLYEDPSVLFMAWRETAAYLLDLTREGDDAPATVDNRIEGGVPSSWLDEAIK